MEDMPKREYAHVGDPMIRDIIEGRSRYSSQAKVEEAISRIKDKVHVSKMSEESGITTIYVRRFALAKNELDQGYLGNFAQLLIVPEGNDFVLYLHKIEVPLDKHPYRPLIEHGGACANWAHPLLRRARKHPVFFDNLDLAYSELNALEHKFESSRRPSDGTLILLVYTRRIENGKPVGKPYFEQAVLKVGFDSNDRPYIFCEVSRYDVKGSTAPVDSDSESTAIHSLSSFIFRSDNLPYLDIAKVLYHIYKVKEGRSDYRMAVGTAHGEMNNDPCVYHYTTHKGLEGILSKKKIWLTDLRFMNDRTEMRHGFELAYELIREAIRQHGLGFGVSSITDDLSRRIESDMVRALRNLEGGNLHRQLFASCFSMDVEQAGAWQAYGGNGSGYAIGFRHKFLKQLANPNLFQYRRVSYHMDRKTAIVNEFLRNSLKSIVAAYDNANPDYGCHLWMDILSYFGSSFKHSSWYHEREWRLMRSYRSTTETDIKIENRYKEITGMVAPAPIAYIDGDIPEIFGRTLNEMIKEIVIGPGQHPYERSNSVRLMLEQNRLFDVSIRVSDVPISSY